jgi:hypothetical protein
MPSEISRVCLSCVAVHTTHFADLICWKSHLNSAAIRVSTRQICYWRRGLKRGVTYLLSLCLYFQIDTFMLCRFIEGYHDLLNLEAGPHLIVLACS